MNIHYKNYPTDYIDSLQNKGKRLKARCFWEYYNDVQNKEVNSFGFYAKSWGVDKPMSKGTVHKWIGEFKDEIQRFYDSHLLLNNEHYISVKKQSERQVNDERTNEQPQTTTTPTFDKTDETVSERQVNKALNINNNNKTARGLYDGFYFLYRQFNKYAGNKLEALDSFMNVDDVDHKRLSVASMFYLKDESVNKKVGVKKFLDNKIYLNYLEMHLKVFVNGGWLNGVYDTDNEVFISDGKEFKLTAIKLAEKFNKNEIKFLKEVAA